MQPVLRFAPSPNGYLHLGHALSALIDFEMAQSLGGRYLLRIEDIDATRCRPEFEQAIYEDLAWLGIRWEEPVRRQSKNLDAYRDALAKLEAQGLVYPSFESRAEIAGHIAQHTGVPWPHDPEEIDATRCRPEFEQAIYEDLAWLGIRWEEPVRRQSKNLDAYRDALAKLEAQGLVYPSFESRAEIAGHIAQHTGVPWPHDPD